MNVPKEFTDLIYSTENHQNYIGMGNPNARILIIGREPAHDLNTESGKENFHQDEELNRVNWRNLIEGKPVEGRCNPRRPFPNQKCLSARISKGGIYNDGTAATWVWYQKLVDLILGRVYDRPYSLRPLDFHDFCFHTDISSAAFKNLVATDRAAKDASVKERSRELFSQPFFRKFPIVILAIGTDVGKYVPLEWCEQVLGFPASQVVKEFDEDAGERMIWANHDNGMRILVHTHCLSQPSWDYLERIRDIVWADGKVDYCWPVSY